MAGSNSFARFIGIRNWRRERRISFDSIFDRTSKNFFKF